MNCHLLHVLEGRKYTAILGFYFDSGFFSTSVFGEARPGFPTLKAGDLRQDGDVTTMRGLERAYFEFWRKFTTDFNQIWVNIRERKYLGKYLGKYLHLQKQATETRLRHSLKGFLV